MEKKTLLLLTTIIGRFEKSCATFGGGEGRKEPSVVNEIIC
jgi:hypothetical protein